MRLYRAIALFLTSALSLWPVTAPANADAWGSTCGMGTQISGPVTLQIEGVPQTPTTVGGNVFPGGYAVDVCRDSSNHSYIITVTNIWNSKNYIAPADADKTFTVGFTPDAGTFPLIAEGHGRIQTFTSDAASNQHVTLEVKPVAWSDIYGDQCGNGTPLFCASTVSTASEDLPADIRVDIRYADGSPTGQGSEGGFADLQGMTWSAAAYYFWLSIGCPAVSGSSSQGLSLQMGGPHLKADGSTPNAGYASVRIPAAAVTHCFGGTAADFVAKTLVTRTEGGSTAVADTAATSDSGLTYTVAVDGEDVLIEVPAVTFSQPTYRITKARSVTAVSKLVRKSRLKTKSGGQVRVAVAKTSRSICVANASSVYGVKKGSCRVTLTSYSSSGRKYKSRSMVVHIK